MKTIIRTLFAIISITLTASATPLLVVETNITEHHAKGGKDILLTPRIVVESGKQASILVGKLEYAITPTLKGDGTVDVRALFTEHKGDKAEKLAAPHLKTKLGRVAEIQIGQLSFITETTLAK